MKRKHYYSVDMQWLEGKEISIKTWFDFKGKLIAIKRILFNGHLTIVLTKESVNDLAFLLNTPYKD